EGNQISGLAEAIGGYRTTMNGSMDLVPMSERLRTLSMAAAASAGGCSATSYGCLLTHWILGDRDRRTVTPLSLETIPMARVRLAKREAEARASGALGFNDEPAADAPRPSAKPSPRV